ncbi:MAG: hypothetical protein ACI85O_002745, partial [Saprospiraceae bacterium]
MKKPLVIFFFLSVLIGGCIILPDFGMTWDEKPQREHGAVSADYVNEYFGWGRPVERHWLSLETYKSKHYGVLFQLTAYTIEEFLSENFLYFKELKNERTEYLLRHYLGFIFFWFASIFFYKILRLRFQDWRIALFGVFLLIFSPRILGHAFVNPKDTVLLSGVILSSYTLIRFVELKNLKYALLHALTCAVVINIRIVGIILPAFTLLFLLFEVLQKITLKKSNFTWLRLSWTVILWGIVLSILTVLFWPYLWGNPLGNLQEAFAVMSKYPWNGKINLYGEWFNAVDVPWYYIPAWMAATTPTLYILAGIAGLFLILKKTILNFFREKLIYASRAEMIDLFGFGFFIGAIFIVVFKESVLYNGWRQMYFIYPAFLLGAMAAFGQISTFIKNTKDKMRKQIYTHILTAVFALQFGATAFFMYQYHPWYHLYFSFLSGKSRTERFEMDYWGAAHKQAFEKIARMDGSAKIKVYSLHYPGELNYRTLPKNLKKRFKFVKDKEDADYIIADFISKGVHDARKNISWPFNHDVFFEFSI